RARSPSFAARSSGWGCLRPGIGTATRRSSKLHATGWKSTNLSTSKVPTLFAKSTRKDGAHTTGGRLRIEGVAADEGPVIDATQVAGLPVRVSGFDGEAGVDGEVHGGLVGEAHLDYVVVARGIELDEVDGFAPDLFKAMEATVAIAADSRLPAPGDYWRG